MFMNALGRRLFKARQIHRLSDDPIGQIFDALTSCQLAFEHHYDRKGVSNALSEEHQVKRLRLISEGKKVEHIIYRFAEVLKSSDREYWVPDTLAATIIGRIRAARKAASFSEHDKITALVQNIDRGMVGLEEVLMSQN